MNIYTQHIHKPSRHASHHLLPPLSCMLARLPRGISLWRSKVLLREMNDLAVAFDRLRTYHQPLQSLAHEVHTHSLLSFSHTYPLPRFPSRSICRQLQLKALRESWVSQFVARSNASTRQQGPDDADIPTDVVSSTYDGLHRFEQQHGTLFSVREMHKQTADVEEDAKSDFQ